MSDKRKCNNETMSRAVCACVMHHYSCERKHCVRFEISHLMHRSDPGIRWATKSYYSRLKCSFMHAASHKDWSPQIVPTSLQTTCQEMSVQLAFQPQSPPPCCWHLTGALTQLTLAQPAADRDLPHSCHDHTSQMLCSAKAYCKLSRHEKGCDGGQQFHRWQQLHSCHQLQATVIAVTKTSRHCTVFCYLLQIQRTFFAAVCTTTLRTVPCMFYALPRCCCLTIQHCYTMHKCGAVHTVSRETDRPGLSLPANKVSSLPTNKLPTSCGGALLSPPGLHEPQKKDSGSCLLPLEIQKRHCFESNACFIV